MGFALYEIAQNQEIQEKARQSIRDVLKRYDGKFTYDAVVEMTYIGYCINGKTS